MMQKFYNVRNYIDGKWVEEKGVKVEKLYNPSTGEVIGEVPITSDKTSVKAIESSQKAFKTWSKTSLTNRVTYLFKLYDAMVKNKEDLAQVIALDQAKHISEARGEVARVIEILQTSCSIPTLIQGETLENVATNITARVTKQPLGVFGGVAPFNFPALVFGWFIPFAIGTGNTFIYKPSTQSPLFMQLMGDIFTQIGLPAGVVNIIHGGRNIPETWYPHHDVRGVCLVGSTPTAKKIAEGCAKYAKRSMLLGGAKNYLVVMEDADIDNFIDNFVISCFGSAGQRCLAGSVVAIAPQIYDEVVQRCEEAVKKITFGDAMNPDIFMGPLISNDAVKNIHKYIKLGLEGGANLLVDGRNPELPDANKNGFFAGPTLFADVKPCNEIVKNEVFGPLAALMKMNCLDSTLELIRKSEFGNGACIFTQSIYYSEKFIQEVDTGMVGVNIGVCAPHPYIPFGGIKGSHLGTNKVQGKDGIDFFTQNKVATIKAVAPSGQKEKSTKSKDIRSCVAS